MPTAAKFYTYTHWAETALKTPISCYSSLPLGQIEDSHPILLIGGVHGDEPEGVRMATDTLNWLKLAEQVTPWIVVPCINPDGFQRQNRTNANGVDLNRNFPGKNWQTQPKKNRYYPGPFSCSELETRALVELLEKEQPRLIVHCHSWEPCVVFTGPVKKTAEKLAEFFNSEAKTSIGYNTPGSLGDYGAFDLNIPVICIEAQEKMDNDKIWPQFGDGLKWLFQHHD